LLRRLADSRPAAWRCIKARIKYLKSANVVLHASSGAGPGAAVRRARLTGTPAVARIPNHPIFAQLSQQAAGSPFTHLRFNTVAHGKLLVFSSGNIIRAGKSTHADALYAVLAFTRWCRALHPALHGMWPAGVNMPNSVWSGQYTTPIDNAILQHGQATYSDRFPGISISLDRTNLSSKITPELFLKSSKWILPGVKDIESLFESAAQLAALHESVAADAAAAQPQ
jgi:TATA-box binding protein (TBP) (component of TFIID and TFIIIB)